VAKGKQPKIAVTPPAPNKHPTQKEKVLGKKTVPNYLEASLKPLDRSPVFRFSLVDLEGKWGWHNVTAHNLRLALQRLKACESQTWKEIEGDKNHLIPFHKICLDARKRLEELNYDDFDGLFSIRVTQVYRIWGFRSDHVLQLLWYDPEHSVYPMNIKGN
jgi:hypothetical protein